MVRKKAKKTCNTTCVGWFILTLLLKVFAIAFLVQGFVLQLTTGVLYYGVLHYFLGIIFVMLAWASMRKTGVCSC
ncbi:hypothetical protein CL616_01015 [archaeon]|nr:hypothetical protein [archaeon]